MATDRLLDPEEIMDADPRPETPNNGSPQHEGPNFPVNLSGQPEARSSDTPQPPAPQYPTPGYSGPEYPTPQHPGSEPSMQPYAPSLGRGAAPGGPQTSFAPMEPQPVASNGHRSNGYHPPAPIATEIYEGQNLYDDELSANEQYSPRMDPAAGPAAQVSIFEDYVAGARLSNTAAQHAEPAPPSDPAPPRYEESSPAAPATPYAPEQPLPTTGSFGTPPPLIQQVSPPQIPPVHTAPEVPPFQAPTEGSSPHGYQAPQYPATQQPQGGYARADYASAADPVAPVSFNDPTPAPMPPVAEVNTTPPDIAAPYAPQPYAPPTYSPVPQATGTEQHYHSGSWMTHQSPATLPDPTPSAPSDYAPPNGFPHAPAAPLEGFTLDRPASYTPAPTRQPTQLPPPPHYASPAPGQTTPGQTMPRLLMQVDSGEIINLTSTVVIGRAPTTNSNAAQLLTIEDPALSVSKTHAAIEVDTAGIYVTDLQSTNGTWLDDGSGTLQRLPAGIRTHIPPGCRVLVGERILTFSR